MHKFFNTDGYCDPELNYMIDLSGRLAEIKKMIDAGKYFTINKARQYGKTTTLIAPAEKGYMLSFNFNKKKKIGVNEIMVGDKLLIEAVV